MLRWQVDEHSLCRNYFTEQDCKLCFVYFYDLHVITLRKPAQAASASAPHESVNQEIFWAPLSYVHNQKLCSEIKRILRFFYC